MTSQGSSSSSTTPEGKKQRNDDEPWRLTVIYTMPIYKLYKHTQKNPTNITGVVPFGQEPIQMLYTSLPFFSLPLYLLRSVDIPAYRKVHQMMMQPVRSHLGDASGGDAISEITKTQEMH